jgi:hypothetical protein
VKFLARFFQGDALVLLRGIENLSFGLVGVKNDRSWAARVRRAQQAAPLREQNATRKGRGGAAKSELYFASSSRVTRRKRKTRAARLESGGHLNRGCRRHEEPARRRRYKSGDEHRSGKLGESGYNRFAFDGLDRFNRHDYYTVLAADFWESGAG